jgi:O-antigen ligase/tetratricopeptide (TPR) repeat protein
MPLAFGSVEAWSVAVVACALAFLLVLLILKLFRPGNELVFSWAYLPIAIFLIWVGVQLLPLPAALAGAISPQALETRRTLLGSLSSAESSLHRFSLSLYTLGTRRDLRTIVCAAAAFVIVVQIARTPRRVRFLLGAIAASGGVVAALAIAQDVTHADRLYWHIRAVDGPFQAVSGPFINHSHFGQFMNLSMGAALALLLPLMSGTTAEPHSYGRRRRSNRLLILALALLLASGAATIAWSRTRGGVLSMTVAALLTGAALVVRRGIRGQRLFIAGLLIAVIFGGAATAYLIKRGSDGASGRFAMVRNAINIWRQFPLVGIGLGAHETVYPMFDSEVNNVVATHVENEYAQVLEETGIVGIAMVLLFLGIIARRWWLASGRQGGNEGLAVFGLGYGLIAVLVHSFTDFGQHLAGNACLTAVACALIVSLSRRRAARTVASETPALTSDFPNRASVFPAPALGWALLLALTVVGIWAAVSSVRAAEAEAHWNRALAAEPRARANGWKGARAERVVNEASAAVAIEPRDIVYQYWLAVYRWRVERAGGEGGEAPGAAKVHELAADLVARLEQAIPLCPTYGPAHAFLGQLEYFSLKQARGIAEIDIGYRLAGYDANNCFTAGVVAAREGRDADAVERLRRAVKLDPLGTPDRIIAVLLREMHRPRIAVDALSQNYFGLTQLMHDLQKNPEPTAMVAECNVMLDAAIKELFSAEGAPAYALSHLGGRYYEQGNYRQALLMYRRCSLADPRFGACEVMVARCLEKLDRKAEAIEVLKQILGNDSGNVEARVLLNAFSAQR